MTFKKTTLCLSMWIISILSTGVYSAEYIDIGYRDGLVIEATVNVDSFVYVVGERSDDSYSYGAGLGYKGSVYSGVFAFSQVVDNIKEYKGELQFAYNDGHFNCFGSVGLQTEKTSLIYKLGVGYPLNEKTSLTTYVSSKGFFIGIRRTM